MYPTEFKDKILDLFKLRVAFDEEMENKELNKLSKKFDKKLSKFVENETRSPKFRAFRHVEEQLKELIKKFDKDLAKLARKHPIAYHRWRKEKRESFEKLINTITLDKNVLMNMYTDLDYELSPEGHKLLFLLSQSLINIQNASKEVRESLQIPSMRKSYKEINAIVNIITALIIVFLRLTEIGKHWEKSNESKQKYMEDLLYWDLNTLSNFTLSLPSKKEKLKVRKVPKEKLLMALYG